MAKRTVNNRAAKSFIKTSHDNDDFIRAINNPTESEYENERKDITPEENQEYIEQNANQEPLDFDDEIGSFEPDQAEETEIVDAPKEEKQPKQEDKKKTTQEEQG